MRFSDKIGVTKPKEVIQLEGMNRNLRNGLWNGFHLFYVHTLYKENVRSISNSFHYGFYIKLWADFFKLTIDEIPYSPHDVVIYVKEGFFDATWFEVYNFIEFVSRSADRDREPFIKYTNHILERENSGYRFINNSLAPITSTIEINEIKSAIENSNYRTLEGVNIHLESALERLSDRKVPDYRGSITESIHAVESVAKIIAQDEKAELSKALKVIKDKLSLHGALESGFKSIYGYTSDADGIRHALLEKSTVEYDDAKYMLISCSAFVNYLIAKANKAGLLSE